MNKFFVCFLVLLLVAPVLCAASSGGSGYQERDRSGWLQSEPKAGGGGLLGPHLGFKFREVPKEVDVKVFGVEPLPYSDGSLVERFFPWSVIGLCIVLVAALYISYRVLGLLGDYFRAKISRGHL